MRTIYERIAAIRGNLIKVKAQGPRLGEVAKITRKDGRSAHASVLKLDKTSVTMQVF